MSFENLPDDWPERPVTDQRIFDDLVDLVATVEQRRLGAIVVLLCDDSARLLQPVAVTLGRAITDPHGEDADRRRLFAPFTTGLAEELSGGGLVAVVARRGHPAPTEVDHRWAQAAQLACDAHALTLFGAAVATPLGVSRLAEPGLRRAG